jgi:diguanylate cyclase (GGDEF)-like protein/PAS domain S-box-containing protein
VNARATINLKKTDKLGQGTLDEVVIGDRSTVAIEDPNDASWILSNEQPKAYLGMPIEWPDKEVFGTLSIMDEKAHIFTDRYHKILSSFKQMVNTDLALLMESDEYSRRSTYVGSQLPRIKTGICLYDEAGKIVSWNKSAKDILGYEEDELVGKPIRVVFPMIDQIEERHIFDVVSKSQELHTLSIEKSNMLSGDGQLTHVLSFTDQTELMMLQNRFSGDLHKDAQTGVFSHHSMIDVLNQETKRALRYKHDLSIIAVTIDGYNFIEEVHGEGSLELVVQTLAIILKNETRDIDNIGRLTDELFIITLPSTPIKAATSVANRIMRVAKRYSDDETPFTISTGVHMVESMPENWLELAFDLVQLKEE